MINFLEFESTKPKPDSLISKYNRVFGAFGVAFNMSAHVLLDRLNHPRNKPPIELKELDDILTKFVTKKKRMIMDDANAIRTGNVAARGVAAKNIRPNNLEYVLVSKSSKLVVVLAMQPNNRGNLLVKVNMVTLMRKANFKVNQGEKITLEMLNLRLRNHTIYDMDDL